VRAPFLAILFLALFSANAAAQTLPGATSGEPAAAAPQKDPLGRETPQGLVSGLVSALSDADYERAVRFFETDRVRPLSGRAVTGAALAQELQKALDQAGALMTPTELSGEPTGRGDDGLAEDMERFGTIAGTDGAPALPLLAHRVERDGKQIWLVSTETLGQVAARASTVESSGGTSLIGIEPRGPTAWGVPASHWAVMAALACLSFLIAWILTAARGLFVTLVKRRYGDTRLTRFVNASAGPVRLLLTVIVFGIALQYVGLTIVARYHAVFLAEIVGWFSLAWVLWRVTDAAGDFFLSQMSQRGRLTAYSAVSFIKRAVKAIFALLLIAVILHSFGVNITTGLAALGIGGLAIALGAQKLFENLIGSLMLIADRPVRIGDFCRFGDSLGTVEDIGIRSTRIRTLDRTILTVPNGEFAALHIENYSSRDLFLFRPTLNLRYETTPDQLRYLLQELRAMLYAHPKVDPDPARVRFISLGAHSLDLEIFAYVIAEDYNEFLEVQEDLLLRCMDIVEASGSGFAFPSQTLYLGRDGGLDETKSGAAEKAVESWREKGELQLPRFSSEEINRLRGRIDYPPRGAAVAKNGG